MKVIGGFRKFKLNLRKFRKLKLFISQVGIVVSQVAKLSCNYSTLCPAMIPFLFLFRKLPKFLKLDSITCKTVRWLISSVFFLLASLFGFWQWVMKLQSLVFSWIWASTCFAMNYTKISLILWLLWWSKSYQKHQNLTQFD